MKAILEIVPVEHTPQGRPLSFTWRRRRHYVDRLLNGWRYGGRWWLGESPRDCWLITAGHLTAELHREDRPDGLWWLARVSD